MMWYVCPKIQMKKLVIGWDRIQRVEVLSWRANHCATGHLLCVRTSQELERIKPRSKEFLFKCDYFLSQTFPYLYCCPIAPHYKDLNDSIQLCRVAWASEEEKKRLTRNPATMKSTATTTTKMTTAAKGEVLKSRILVRRLKGECAMCFGSQDAARSLTRGRPGSCSSAAFASLGRYVFISSV